MLLVLLIASGIVLGMGDRGLLSLLTLVAVFRNQYYNSYTWLIRT